MAAIAVAQLIRFLSQVKSVTGAPGRDEVKGLLIIAIEGITGNRLLHLRHRRLDLFEQIGAALQAVLWHFFAQGQVVEFNLFVWVLVKIIRVVSRAEESGRAAFADDVALL